ncbi:uncharacterized protein LOC109718471 [Ananas comosus]|uniref:Uncharacterized protein LOC109718471 n=1 Tax=Ananas comosus TaxID=4615 RepID=A0A6P5FXD9_ANACO|nr:uncharacterized protein LOC109718471 [Ananas comosus]
MDPFSESPVGIPRNPNAPAPAPAPSSSLGPFVEHVAGEEENPAALPFPLLPWRARRCDVYLGFSGAGDGPAVRRLVAWLRAELEAQGIACFAARGAGAAREAAMGAASLGVVVVSAGSLSSPCSVEEILMFSERGNLVPLFFGVKPSKEDSAAWMRCGGSEKECAAALHALSCAAVRLEADEGNLRGCVFDAVELIGLRLGRKYAAESVRRWRELAADEFPFPRNANFVGRTRELHELELLLFGEAANSRASMSAGPSKQFAESSKGEGEMPPMWEQFEDDIERSSGGNGVACVCGDSGIGKTELLLEFAYRFSKRYKLVLWAGGEVRYLRENYMKLLPRLGIDVGFESEVSLGSSRRGSFELMEGDAVGRVRKELARDIPFLLVIDNLESEKDWWDGRSIVDLLPRSGGGTHVIISTRLPQISIGKPLRLSHLPPSEALSLMKGSSRDLRTQDIDALRLIEEKIGRLPLGLAIVGAIFCELRIGPLELLNAIDDMPMREISWVTKDDVLLSRNPFLVQLLDLCFSLLDREKNLGKLASRMIEASSWFAPSPIPISMLALAARGISKGRQQLTQVRKGFARVLSCSLCIAPAATKNNPEAEASSMLIRFGLARSCAREGYLSFHDIVNLHARRRSNAEFARSAVVRAIIKEGSVSRHSDHVWAACFLLFRSGTGPVTVDLPTRDLLSFIKRFVLPLASQSFTMFSMYNAVLELLRLSSRALEVLVDSFLSEEKKYASSCFNPKRMSSVEPNPLLYCDLERVRATILDRRAMIMMRGCQHDVAEQLCRTAVGIKEVIYGPEHPETRSTCILMEQSIMCQSKF